MSLSDKVRAKKGAGPAKVVAPHTPALVEAKEEVPTASRPKRSGKPIWITQV